MPDIQFLKNNPAKPRFVLICTCLLALVLLLPVAGATPPSDITVNYDKTTNQLLVTVSHATADPTTHYIRNVKVDINGRVVIDNDYKSQPTKDTFTYTYPVQVNTGDTVRVTGTCNVAGSKEVVFTLPTTTAVPAASPPSTPVATQTAKSPAGLLPFAGLVVLGILVAGKNRN